MFRFEDFSRTVFVIYGIVVVLMIAVTLSRASFRRRQRSVPPAATELGPARGRCTAPATGGGAGHPGTPDRRRRRHAVRIIGFIDDDPRKRRARVRGYPVLGPYETLSHLVTSGSVDAVVLSMRAIDSGKVRELESVCAAGAVQLSRLQVALESLVEPGRGIGTGALLGGSRGRKLQMPAVKGGPAGEGGKGR